ncbi:hypothetical protein JW948_16650, partial [bacterium]|nr:hypothetical protein [bacterium]
MKRCVIISAYFPPVGGIGVQRVSKLVKYLPAGGWHPVVITTPRHALRMPQDPSMLRDLPDSLEIHRPFYYDSRKIIPGDIAKLYAPVEKRI